MAFNLFNEMLRLEALYNIPNPTGAGDVGSNPDGGGIVDPNGNVQTGSINMDGRIIIVEAVTTSSNTYYIDSNGNVYSYNLEGKLFLLTPDMASLLDGSALESGEFEYIGTDTGDFYLHQNGTLNMMCGTDLLPVTNTAPFQINEVLFGQPDLSGDDSVYAELEAWEGVTTDFGTFFVHKGIAYKGIPTHFRNSNGEMVWAPLTWPEDNQASIEDIFGPQIGNDSGNIINLDGGAGPGGNRSPVFIRDGRAPDAGAPDGGPRQGYTIFWKDDVAKSPSRQFRAHQTTTFLRAAVGCWAGLATIR